MGERRAEARRQPGRADSTRTGNRGAV